MKVLYVNLNVLHIRCDGRNNIKEKCSCISVVVPSKKNGWAKWLENCVKDIIENLMSIGVFMGKTKKIRFSVKADFELSFSPTQQMFEC